MRTWLSSFAKGDEDFVMTSTAESGVSLFRLALSPEKGLFCELKASIPASPLGLHYAVIVSPERAVVVSHSRRTIQPITDRFFEMAARIEVTASGAGSERPFLFNFIPSITTVPGRDRSGVSGQKARFRLEMDFLPAAFVGMAHLDGVKCETEEGLLEIDASLAAMKIDVETGRLVELDAVLFDDVEHFRIAGKGRFAKGAFDEMVGSFLESCRDYESVQGQGRPISSLCSFATSEIMHHLLAAAGEASEADRGASIAMTAAISRFAEHVAFESLDRLIAKTPAAEEGAAAPFVIPSARPGSGPDLTEIVVRAGIPMAHRFFPPQSWPCTLIRESLLMVSGKGLYARAELQRLYESDRVGPFGFCATAHLLTFVDGRMAKAFAAKGMRLLNSEGFQRDCLALIEGDSILGEIVLKTAGSLRTLSAGEAEALGAGIGGLAGEVFVACTRRLHESGERPLGEALPAALEPLWDRVLKDRVEAMLREILDK